MPDSDPGFPNTPNPPEERRSQRSIMTTESEWRIITSRAERAGMTASQFLVHRALDAGESPLSDAIPPATLPGVQRRLALATLVMARIEEMRMRTSGEDYVWEKLVEEESAFLDSEDLLGPGLRERKK